jgi:hypothetical protein
MRNEPASILKVVSISSTRVNGAVSQRDLARAGAKGREAETARLAADRLESEHSAMLAEIQEAIERGAVVEAGPLGATIKTRKFLILRSGRPA